jgi:hypothetical protein
MKPRLISLWNCRFSNEIKYYIRVVMFYPDALSFMKHVANIWDNNLCKIRTNQEFIGLVGCGPIKQEYKHGLTQLITSSTLGIEKQL